jgi:hypothetical protein
VTLAGRASAISSTPVPSSPLEGEEILTPDVTLAVATTSGAVSYVFQVFSDASLTTLVHEATAIAGTAGTTSIVFDGGGVNLVDDDEYEWRACAFDGVSCSPWSAPQRFRYDPTNDPPGLATPDSPLFNGHVSSLAPVLVAGNPAPDDDPPGTMTFSVFTEDPSEGGILLRSSGPIQIGASGSTTWVVDPPLADDTFYWWRVIVADLRGESTVSAASSFRVNLANDEPGSPTLLGPPDGAVVALLQPTLGATGAQDPDGDLVTYHFDLDVTPAFNSTALQSGPATLCGVDNGDFCFTPPVPLVENTRYWWRARCSDGFSIGEPAVATFFVDVANDPPGAPVAVSPAGVLTLEATPAFVALAATDPEEGALAYEFEVLDEGEVVDSAAGVTPLVTDDRSVAWTPSTPLPRGRLLTWHVRAVDSLGLAGDWSAAAAFEVRSTKESGGGGGCAVTGLRSPGAASIFTGIGALLLIGLRRRGCRNFEKRSADSSWC